jgi:hypothetical protein
MTPESEIHLCALLGKLKEQETGRKRKTKQDLLKIDMSG